MIKLPATQFSIIIEHLQDLRFKEDYSKEQLEDKADEITFYKTGESVKNQI